MNNINIFITSAYCHDEMSVKTNDPYTDLIKMIFFLKRAIQLKSFRQKGNEFLYDCRILF